jgi:hypothetical protein
MKKINKQLLQDVSKEKDRVAAIKKMLNAETKKLSTIPQKNGKLLVMEVVDVLGKDVTLIYEENNKKNIAVVVHHDGE